jgi:hypothetical protein
MALFLGSAVFMLRRVAEEIGGTDFYCALQLQSFTTHAHGKLHHLLNSDCFRAGAWWNEKDSLEHKKAWAAWVSRKAES